MQKHHSICKILNLVNKFDFFVCETYLTQIELDMIVILKVNKSSIDDSEKLENELTRLRLDFEDCKLKIVLRKRTYNSKGRMSYIK